jgi:hypothetical protein
LNCRTNFFVGTPDGKGLGAVWGEELAAAMLGDAGFSDVRAETLEHDMINHYYIMRK